MTFVVVSYLVLGVRLEQQHVDGRQLADEAVALKLLSHAVADDGDGHGHVVHGLHLGGLSSIPNGQRCVLPKFRAPRLPSIVELRLQSCDCVSSCKVAQSNEMTGARGGFEKRTPLNHSRYDERTRRLASVQLAAALPFTLAKDGVLVA